MKLTLLWAVICTVIGSVLLFEPGGLTDQQQVGAGILIAAPFAAWLAGVEL